MEDAAPPPANSRLTPQFAVAILILVFGTIFALTTPPAQPPDEPEHWERVWQLSEGIIVASDYGGEIPQSVVACADRFRPLCYHSDRQTAAAAVFQEYHRPLLVSRTVHRRFAAQTIYSPVPYLPQVLGVGLGRLLNLPPIALLQLGRVANVAVYALLCWASVRVTPILKWPACMILAAPLPVFLAGSLSADPATIGFAALAIGLMLRMILAPAGTVIPTPMMITVGAVLLALALCKSAYFPLGGLLLAAPASAWGTQRRRWVFLSGIVGLSIAAMGVWSWLSVPMHANFWGLDPATQMQWVSRHPLTFVEVLLSNLWHGGEFLIYCTVGNLGCLDTPLSIQSLDAYFLALAWVILNYGEPLVLRLRVRLLAAGIIVICTLLFSVYLYVSMNPAGSWNIINLQGRYFLPLALLFCMLLHRQGRYAVRPPAVVAGMFLLSIYAVGVAIVRYYG